MSEREKLLVTIEKLSRLTLSRGATAGEEAVAKQKIKDLQVRLEDLEPETGPMVGPGVTWATGVSPERMAQAAKNMEEWERVLDSLYRRMGQPRPRKKKGRL